LTAAKLKNHHAFVIRSPMIDTRGSILAAGIQHASWNAAQNLNVVEMATGSGRRLRHSLCSPRWSPWAGQGVDYCGLTTPASVPPAGSPA
jgi:hypothetical protein